MIVKVVYETATGNQAKIPDQFLETDRSLDEILERVRGMHETREMIDRQLAAIFPAHIPDCGYFGPFDVCVCVVSNGDATLRWHIVDPQHPLLQRRRKYLRRERKRS